MLDLDGDKVVTPAEVLEVFQQMGQVRRSGSRSRYVVWNYYLMS